MRHDIEDILNYYIEDILNYYETDTMTHDFVWRAAIDYFKQNEL